MEVRLRDGEYVEASFTMDGEVGPFDLTILHFGFLPISEQKVLKFASDTGSPYDSWKPYYTKIGSCDNRGEEKLWQFQLFPEVLAGLTDEFVTEAVVTETATEITAETA